MANYNGQLKSNEIFASIYNMIISQEVFANNIRKSQTLVDKARVDGGLYGDTKLYYGTDVLASYKWGKGGIKDVDGNVVNILNEFRPTEPTCQAIVLDVFRQIPVTIDNYLSKRAWSTEGAFNEFNTVILGWLSETKKVYDGTTYNAFIGTHKAGGAKQSITWTLTQGKEGQEIAQKLADLLVEIGDYSRDFNDDGFLRSFDASDLKVIWNAKFVNQIKKIDLPTIFHNEGLVDKLDDEVMPARYFGDVVDATKLADISAAQPTTGKPINSSTGAYTPGTNNANGKVCSLIELVLKVSNTQHHVFPGDELPAGATVGSGKQFGVGETYVPNEKVICKIVVGDKLPPYMSAFEVGTSFFNAMTLAENHYLTFGHNTLQHIKDFPYITIAKS